MVENIFRKIGVLGSLLMLIILGSILTTSHFATAYVRYGPAAQLGTGDIKTLHILDSTILSADMANYNSLILASSTIGSLTATSSATLPAGSITSANILNSEIVNADINTSAAVAYSKLNLTGSLLNADISTAAAISTQKIATTSTTFFINDIAQTMDGIKTFTSIPVLPASDPTADNQAARKLYVDNASLGTIYKYTAGTAIPSNTAVFVATTTNTDGDVQGWAVGTGQPCGQAAPNVGQCAETTLETFHRAVTSIDLRLIKNGSPTDNVVVSLQTTTGDVPSDIQIASTTVAASSIGVSFATTTFTFTNPPVLAGNTKYALVIGRSGARDNTNYIGTDIEGVTTRYVNGHHKPYTSSWLDQTTHDMTFKLNYVGTTADSLYISNASSVLLASSTIGYVKTGVASGATATVITSGTWTGLGGLTTLGEVFLSTASGLIGGTTGAVNYKMGWAVSSTTALIKPGIFEQ